MKTTRSGTLCTCLILLMMLSGAGGTIANAYSGSTTEELSGDAVMATPNTAPLILNGTEIVLAAFNINGNNYFKLRDMAGVVSGTTVQFDVRWNEEKRSIELLSEMPYAMPPKETVTPMAAWQHTNAVPSGSPLFLDGEPVLLTAYTIHGSNYFKLRDLGSLFNFAVDWDAGNNRIVMDTESPYVMEALASNDAAFAAPVNYKPLDAGTYKSMLVRGDGSLWATGSNINGELGIGGTVNRKVYVRIFDGVAGVSGNAHVTLILRADGSLYGCGANTDSRVWWDAFPREIIDKPRHLMSGVRDVAVGAGHYVVLKNDGTVWTWGENTYGALGDGTSDNRLLPGLVMSGAVDIEASGYNTFVRKADNTLWGWGWNTAGQLGIGTTESQVSPVKMFHQVIDFDCDWNHTAAITADGTLWAWGGNSSGELGDGTYQDRLAPIEIMRGVTRVQTGAAQTGALGTDGSLWLWGKNTPHPTSVPESYMTGVAAFSLSDHAMVLKTDGTLWSWGANAHGQIGNNTSLPWTGMYWFDDNADVATPVKVASGLVVETVVEAPVVNGPSVVVPETGISSDGLYEYTRFRGEMTLTRYLGQAQTVVVPPMIDGARVVGIEQPGFSNVAYLKAVTLPATLTFISNAAFEQCTALTEVNLPASLTVLNGYQFRDTPWQQEYPADFVIEGAGVLMRYQGSEPVVEIPETVAYIGAGAFRSLDITGVVLPESVRHVADSAFAGCASLEEVVLPQTVNAVSANAFSGCESLATVTVWNPEMSIKRVFSGSPYLTVHAHEGKAAHRDAVAEGLRFVPLVDEDKRPEHLHETVALNELANYFIREDGSLWGWGWNGGASLQALGGWDDAYHGDPVRMGEAMVSVDASGKTVVGLNKDGALWRWGGADFDVTPGDATNTPALLREGIDTFSLGESHMVAVDENGVLWGWGSNAFNQMGDITAGRDMADRITNMAVKLLDDVASASAGAYHTVILKKDGSVWQLGSTSGSLLDTGKLTKIMDGAVQVSAGTACSAAIKRDGSLWTWGLNFKGQLGDGTTTARSVPIRIMDAVSQVVMAKGGTAIRVDGTVWSWGINEEGQVGDGTSIQRLKPVKVMADGLRVSRTARRVMVLKADGTLWGWGGNLAPAQTRLVKRELVPVLLTSGVGLPR